MQLEIRTMTTHERIRLLRLAGTLSAADAATLEEHAQQAMDQGRHLVLNMAAITFVSSTGLGVLLAINEDFAERGLSLRLSAPSPAVVTPIELLCLDKFLRICASDDEAYLDLAA